MVILGWLILWIPFCTAVGITLLLLTRPRIAGWAATLGLFIPFLLSLILLIQYKSHGLHAPPLESSVVWIPLGAAKVEFGILINGLSLLMLLIVTGIGSLIFLYSVTYMSHEEGQPRYFASLSFFAFSMLGIVLANNLIQIFIFWELVGFSSYLLISFWFEKTEAATAGKKAFLTTRVGDVGMLIGILLLFGILAEKGTPTFNFLQLQGIGAGGSLLANIDPSFMTAIGILIFLGVVGKSAQVPLHVWLPDAMEGPTPVSAFIHAATMVAAGVFLLVRINFLFEASPDVLTVIAWTGGVTALLAGTIAIVQNDIKKILAYSTLSQLGYMVLALGLHNPEAGMFHLTTHAFFKALLFLGAGSLIHALHTQNIWEMGNPKKSLLISMPVTSLTFLLATLALAGIPPLSGYFSKEEILATAHQGPALLFWMAMATVFLTAFYMGRLCTIVFFRSRDKYQDSGKAQGHEADWRMTVPLIILGVFSAIAGFLPIKLLLTGHSTHVTHETGFLEAASLALAAAGLGLSFFIYRKRSYQKAVMAFTPIAGVLEKKYFFDELYDAGIHYIQENIARISGLFERFVIVMVLVNGVSQLTRWSGHLLRKLQTGVVQFYAFVFAIGVTTLIFAMIIAGQP